MVTVSVATFAVYLLELEYLFLNKILKGILGKTGTAKC